MNDTSAEIRRMLRERYAKMTGAERLMAGAGTFETARAMALASFPAGLSMRENRRRLCERFYETLAERVYGGE